MTVPIMVSIDGINVSIKDTHCRPRKGCVRYEIVWDASYFTYLYFPSQKIMQRCAQQFLCSSYSEPFDRSSDRMYHILECRLVCDLDSFLSPESKAAFLAAVCTQIQVLDIDDVLQTPHA